MSVADGTVDAEARPAAGTPFTVADLDATPDDGRRYQLLDGVLVVSPRPVIAHQWVATRRCGRRAPRSLT